MKRDYYFLTAITVLGALLRFWNLTDKPLWVDEALFGYFVRDGAKQEFIPIWIAQLLGLTGENLRYISAVAGTLTIPATYFVMKGKWRLEAAVFVCVFPLFVFWSRMARPYALAGLLIVLGWRWWIFYIPAVMTTPISLLGMKISKDRWKVLVGFAAVAVAAFLIRGDSGRDFWNLRFITNSSRLFYIPILGAVLHCAYYLFNSDKFKPS